MTACARRAPQVVEDQGPQIRSFEHLTIADLVDEGGGFAPLQHPDFPSLPRYVNERTSEADLSAQAIQVAFSEYARGELDSQDSVDFRYREILAFWLPQYHILQDLIALSEYRQGLWHAYEMEQARYQAAFIQDLEQMQRSWDQRIREEERRVLPLIPPELAERLLQEARAIDRQRSRVSRIVP